MPHMSGPPMRVAAYREARELLRATVSQEAAQNWTAAEAGSSSLYFYQEDRAVGPSWGMPNDLDVFVAGKHGSSKESFCAFVGACMENMRSQGQIVDSTLRKCGYSKPGVEIWIMDLCVSGLFPQVVISFVQAPGHRDVLSAVEDFDISVCKVAFNVASGQCCVQPDVALEIATGRACMKELVLPEEEPFEKHNEAMASQAMRRFHSYCVRGFVFEDGFRIVHFIAE